MAPGTHYVDLNVGPIPEGELKGYAFVPFTVTAAPTGTLTVTSENSVVTSTLVNASWTQAFYYGSIADPCSAPYSYLCSGTKQTYLNMPTGTYQLSPSLITLLATSSATSSYVLHSVEQAPIAKKSEVNDLILAFFEYLFGTAKADIVCGWEVINGTTTSSSCPNATPSLSIPDPGDEANFIILWDPVAAISVSPSTVSLSAATPYSTSTQVTLANSGAQGSTLDWAASSSAPWLTVYPTSGCLSAGGQAVNGCSDTNGYEYLTLTANSSWLATGTYTGTVTFNGTSSPPETEINPLPEQSLTVTFTVGAAPPPPSNPPSCAYFTATPSTIVPPASSVLSWSCSNTTSCSLDGTPVPISGSESVSPTTDTTYTLTCQGASATSSITVDTTVTTQGPSNIHEINP